MNVDFEQKIALLQQQHEALLQRSNLPVEETNGIVCRYTYPIVTREHIPLEWRYDFNPATNPYCMERIGFNATMNSGAIKWNGKYVLVVRVEGADRKSFFAVAESPNGIDKIILRTGIECIFSINKLRMKHYVPLLTVRLQVRQTFPFHQILGTDNTCLCHC